MFEGQFQTRLRRGGQGRCHLADGGGAELLQGSNACHRDAQRGRRRGGGGTARAAVDGERLTPEELFCRNASRCPMAAIVGMPPLGSSGRVGQARMLTQVPRDPASWLDRPFGTISTRAEGKAAIFGEPQIGRF